MRIPRRGRRTSSDVTIAVLELINHLQKAEGLHLEVSLRAASQRRQSDDMEPISINLGVLIPEVEVRLTAPAEVDRQLTAWLRAAYELAGP